MKDDILEFIDIVREYKDYILEEFKNKNYKKNFNKKILIVLKILIIANALKNDKAYIGLNTLGFGVLFIILNMKIYYKNFLDNEKYLEFLKDDKSYKKIIGKVLMEGIELLTFSLSFFLELFLLEKLNYSNIKIYFYFLSYVLILFSFSKLVVCIEDIRYWVKSVYTYLIVGIIILIFNTLFGTWFTFICFFYLMNYLIINSFKKKRRIEELVLEKIDKKFRINIEDNNFKVEEINNLNQPIRKNTEDENNYTITEVIRYFLIFVISRTKEKIKENPDLYLEKSKPLRNVMKLIKYEFKEKKVFYTGIFFGSLTLSVVIPIFVKVPKEIVALSLLAFSTIILQLQNNKRFSDIFTGNKGYILMLTNSSNLEIIISKLITEFLEILTIFIALGLLNRVLFTEGKGYILIVIITFLGASSSLKLVYVLKNKITKSNNKIIYSIIASPFYGVFSSIFFSENNGFLKIAYLYGIISMTSFVMSKTDFE